jgi:hypothetical protein
MMVKGASRHDELTIVTDSEQARIKECPFFKEHHNHGSPKGTQITSAHFVTSWAVSHSIQYNATMLLAKRSKEFY